jgi:hypothetical protein
MPGEMMSHAKTIVETTRSYLGLGVDVGRKALQAVYVPTEKLTEERFANWIGDALVGQSIQYHEGFLLLDRSESGSGLGTKERNRLHSVARRAWIACELGLVHLFSLKVADGHYRYIAIRSSSKLTPPEIRARLRKTNASATVETPEITH